MRAVLQWLALVPILIVAGCSTFHQTPPPVDSGFALSGADDHLAGALAHYSQALISENTLGEFQSGVSHYRQAAALDPSSLPLNLKVAVDYIGRKDFTGAVVVLRRAVQCHPDSADVQLLYGSVCQALGKSDEAARAFRTAIRLAPDRPDGYVRLATLHVVRLAPRKALDVVADGMLHLKDSEPLLDFCETVGRIYLAGKDVAGAIRLFEPVFRHGSGHEETCEWLGHCYTLLHQHGDAAGVYQSLLAKQPGNSRYALLLGESHEAAGDFVRAKEAYFQAVKGLPVEPMASLRLANLQMVDSPEQGLATLEESVARYPDDLRIHIFLAISYMRLERFADSLAQFNWIAGVMARDETVARTVQPLFYFWYGQVCERTGHPEDGERLIEKYLSLNPHSDEALNYLAYMWAEQGRNLDRAMAYVMRALGNEPGNGAYLDTLGWILYKKGSYDLALKKLTRALDKEGAAPVIMEHVGDTWYALKNRDKAVRMWMKSLKLAPDNKGLREKLIRENVESRRLPPLPEIKK